MTDPKGQDRPGTLVVHPGDGKKPGGEEPRVLAGTGPHQTSTHYVPRGATQATLSADDLDPGDAPRPGGTDSAVQNALGYRSTDQGNLPAPRDVTGGRIRHISSEE